MIDWDAYIEDSGISKPSPYMILGGIMLKTEHALRLRDSIGRWRRENGLLDEIKWEKVTRDRLARYKEFARGALHYINNGDMTFSCARFDREDNRLFTRAEKIDASDKKAYQLLLHGFVLRAKQTDRLFVYPDRGLIRGSTVALAEMLNAGAASAMGWRGVDVVRSIHPKESNDCHFVQMADILAGAVNCLNNNLHDISSSRGEAKQALAEFIQERAGVSLSLPTAIRSKFHIWFFQPRKKIASINPTTSAEPRVQTGHSTP